MSTPYLPRHQRRRAALSAHPAAIAANSGPTGSHTGPDILFLVLTLLTVLSAFAAAGGLAAHLQS